MHNSNNTQTRVSFNHKYISNSVGFVALSLLSSLLNYVYYPVIAHFLTPSAFGATQSLIAILLQIGAVFSGLNLVTIYLVRKLDEQNAKQAIEALQKITTLLFVTLTVLVTIGQSFVMHFLHIDRRLYLLLVSLDLLTTIPFIIAFGYLQAQKRFISAGILQLCIVLVKLVAGGLAAKLFGVAGAIVGFAIGQVGGMVLFWLLCTLNGRPAWSHRVLHSLHPPSRLQLAILRPYSRTITAVFCVNVLLVLFISFDIISARHYLVPSLSGLYSGASTISNAIVFACLPLISVLLPHLDMHTLKKNRTVLTRTVAMVCIVVTSSILILLLAPHLLLGLFGQQYLAMTYLLWRLGVLMSLVAGINLVMQVGALYTPLRTAVACAIGFASLIITVMHHHQSPSAIVSGIMVIFATLFGVGVFQLIWLYNNGTRIKT